MADSPLDYRGIGKQGYQPWGDAFWGAVAVLLFAGTLVLFLAGLAFRGFAAQALIAQVGTALVGVFIAVVGTDFDREKTLANLALLLNALSLGCGCCTGLMP